MRSHSARIILVLLLTMLLAGPVFAGGQQEGEPQTGGTDAAVVVPEGEYAYQNMSTDAYELELFFYASWGSGYDPTGEELTAQIEKEKTGVTVDVTVPGGGDQEFLNLLVASGDLPDVMVLEVGDPMIQRMADNDLIYSYQELAEQYAPNFFELIPDEIEAFHSFEDGNLYYLPSFHYLADDFQNAASQTNMRLWHYRSDIWEELGRPVIDSPESAIEVLSRVKEEYPNIEPMAFSESNPVDPFHNVNMNMFATAFGEFKGNTVERYMFYEPSANKVLYPWRSPAYLETYEFFNRMFREGILEPELVILPTEQSTERRNNGEFFWIPAFETPNRENTSIRQNLGEDAVYRMGHVFKANDREPTYPSNRGLGWTGLIITKNAEDPRKVTRWAQYRWSQEGQWDSQFGVEGETYTLQDGAEYGRPGQQVPVPTDEVRELRQTDQAEWTARYGFDRSMVWRPEMIGHRDFFKSDYALDVYETRNEYAVDYVDDGYFNIEPASGTDQAVIHTQIKDIWTRASVELILADSDEEFQEIYDQAVADSEAAGASRVEEVFLKRRNDLRAQFEGN